MSGILSRVQGKIMLPLIDKGSPSNALEKAIIDNGIGEYGVSVCNKNGKSAELLSITL